MPLEKWSGEIAESVEIPKLLFSGKCSVYDSMFMFNLVDDFPDPGWKNPVAIKVNNQTITIENNSVLISEKDDLFEIENSQISIVVLYSTKIAFYFIQDKKYTSLKMIMVSLGNRFIFEKLVIFAQ